MKKISGFFGEYRWLSNFWLTPVFYRGHIWPSSEHAYQAAKFVDTDWPRYYEISKTRTPGEAKRIGREGNLRPDWEEVKYDVMLEIVRAKFKTESLAAQLKATIPYDLEEENPWNDTYWGTTKGVGENNLGKILMQVRMELFQ